MKISGNRAIGPRRNNRRIYFNLARPALERIRQRRKQEKKKELLELISFTMIMYHK